MIGTRIAVIGSGIAGLSAAWLLGKSQAVTLFEAGARLGGHSNTITVSAPEGPLAIDSGFIVYNERNYPNLTAFFSHLEVPTQHTDMSFAVSVARGRMEYSGNHLNGLFGQRRNIVRFEHWQLVSDILRFFRSARVQAASVSQDVSIGTFLERFGYSRIFIEDHILPVSAAIWSTPARGMLDFPARTFIEFFANHGLLQVNNRPKWRTVTGGSQSYVRAIQSDASFEARTNSDIVSVLRHAQGVELYHADGSREHFDQVVFACHADEALRLLGDATPVEREILGAFRFTPNRAVLHTDASFMPRRKHLWSSWNYLRSAQIGGQEPDLSVTYWMNRLQNLPSATQFFVTLNPSHAFAPGSVHHDVTYEHPLFDAGAITAQRRIWEIQGQQRSWFAGAWLGHGFHEDGLQAGLEVAERIGPLNRPWIVDQHRGRIAHNWADGESLQWAAE